MAKANIEINDVKTWLELHHVIDEYFTHFNFYVYRGQAQEEWVLEPTLTKMLKVYYPNTKSWESLTKSHFDTFKKGIRGRCSIDLKNSNDDEIWSFGQHNGLYTPLLDWSRSPYVALFFAFQGPCDNKTKKRSLWALNLFDIDDINEGYRQKTPGKKISVDVVDPITHENYRLVSQGGLFLKVTIGCDIETWVKNGIDTKCVSLYKFTFPDSIKNEVLGALDNMNINHNSLFPDIGGASLHTNYKFIIEPYLSKKRDEMWKNYKKKST